MEGNKSQPRVILVFGAPCSGKSTFSEKFSAKFDLAYYDFDTLRQDYRLTRKNVLLIMKLLARTGKTMVIEGAIGTEREREEVRNIFRMAGYRPSLVWIQTDVNTIRLRMKTKYKSVVKARTLYDESVNGLEAPSEFEKPIILSGKHTFETQVRHILAGLADGNDK